MRLREGLAGVLYVSAPPRLSFFQNSNAPPAAARAPAVLARIFGLGRLPLGTAPFAFFLATRFPTFQVSHPSTALRLFTIPIVPLLSSARGYRTVRVPCRSGGHLRRRRAGGRRARARVRRLVAAPGDQQADGGHGGRLRRDAGPDGRGPAEERGQPAGQRNAEARLRRAPQRTLAARGPGAVGAGAQVRPQLTVG